MFEHTSQTHQYMPRREDPTHTHMSPNRALANTIDHQQAACPCAHDTHTGQRTHTHTREPRSVSPIRYHVGSGVWSDAASTAAPFGLCRTRQRTRGTGTGTTRRAGTGTTSTHDSIARGDEKGPLRTLQSGARAHPSGGGGLRSHETALARRPGLLVTCGAAAAAARAAAAAAPPAS